MEDKEVRIGAYVCHCGSNIAGVVDTRAVAEHVEPWTYVKFPYLKNVGWKGFVDGKESGVFRVAPLARLNAADGMATSASPGSLREDVFHPRRQASPSHPGYALGSPY